jgi:hypothetical protein
MPAVIAEAMGFSKGETVKWENHVRRTMVLQRLDAPASPLGKRNVDPIFPLADHSD